jgi:hypothetical protein
MTFAPPAQQLSAKTVAMLSLMRQSGARHGFISIEHEDDVASYTFDQAMALLDSAHRPTSLTFDLTRDIAALRRL